MLRLDKVHSSVDNEISIQVMASKLGSTKKKVCFTDHHLKQTAFQLQMCNCFKISRLEMFRTLSFASN